jgi:uncharacterized protein (TIGR02996 family)
MVELVDLIRAAQAQPLEDAPRLILADWLEEQGDSDRAEFLRLDCELDNLELEEERQETCRHRLAELLALHKADWLAPLHNLEEPPTVFCPLTRLELGFPVFLTRAEKLFRVAPLLRLVRCVDDAGMADLPLVAVTREGPCPVRLNLADTPLNPEQLTVMLDRLSRQPFLARLAGLHLAQLYLGQIINPATFGQAVVQSFRSMFGLETGAHPQVWIATLFQSPYLANLRSLDLSGNALDGKGTRTLGRARHLVNVAELNLSENTTNVIALLRSSLLGAIRSLNLSANGLHTEDIERLFTASQLPNLVRLDLSRNPFQQLPPPPSLPNLRWLSLRQTGLFSTSVSLLTQASRLPRLAWLDLAENRLADVAIKPIFTAEHWAGLRGLDLSGNLLGPGRQAITALHQAGHLQQLRTLKLNRCQLRDVHLQELATAPHLASLTTLELEGNTLTDAAGQALLASPLLRGVETLNLRGSTFSPPMIEALQRRFGSAVLLHEEEAEAE